MTVGRKLAVTVTVAGGLLLAVPPAWAGFVNSYTLTATPNHGVPGAAITLSGGPGSGTPCPNDSYTVTGSYATNSGGNGTQTINGTTDSTGKYSSATNIPTDAKPGAFVGYSTVVSCGGAGTFPSNTASVSVDQAAPASTTTSSTSTSTTSTSTVSSTTSSTTSTTVARQALAAAAPATAVAATPTFTG